VVATLQRKGGATISELMRTMGWQRHTVRGFMAGSMKKAGYAVEAFKPEGGERSYRINKWCRAPVGTDTTLRLHSQPTRLRPRRAFLCLLRGLAQPRHDCVTSG
jgi:hypothetical protein